jgi:AraC-like DNA-binding protein
LPTIAPQRLWRTTYDSQARVHRHELATGFGHALMVSLQSYAFKALRISAAVWSKGTDWFPIHDEPNIGEIELDLGVERERSRYNEAHLQKAWQARVLVRGEHAGYSDLFVPIVARKKTAGILVVGPFSRSQPAARNICEQWQRLARRPGHVDDPDFASYIAAALSVLVLEGSKSATFERLVGCIARLMAAEGPADAIANECALLCEELERERLPERMWDGVRTMIDERHGRTWQSAYRAHELRRLGLSRPADHILVGLLQSRRPEDAVEDLIRRNAFQRAAVDLAQAEGDVASGQVGNRGVVFLCAGADSGRQRERQLARLAQRVDAMGRDRFGLVLFFGASAAPGSAAIDRSYRAALAAAESAFSRGIPFVRAEPDARETGSSLWQLRGQLSLAVRERPGLLPARFERYLDAITRHCGDRVQPARAHLEIGFERAAEALAAGGAIDEKNLLAMRESLARAADAAQGMPELLAAFRAGIGEIARALEHPVVARQDRSMKRAIDYVREHYTEPLRLENVARLAGFAPAYFSRLFRKREHASFASYVIGLRIERAKQLLLTTELDAARVGLIAGFGTPQHFSAMFRRETGVTPGGWRAKRRSAPKSRTAEKRKHKVNHP